MSTRECAKTPLKELWILKCSSQKYIFFEGSISLQSNETIITASKNGTHKMTLVTVGKIENK